jgi:transposase, IS6 family
VDHTTIYRWVQRYAPELEKRCRPSLKVTSDSWRVDETYAKIKDVWMYLYRAVDSQGNALEFQLSPTRYAQAAKRFFTKALSASHTVVPRVITVDKNAAYPKAFGELKAAGTLADSCELRQSKYLNNLVEQDHRFIKWLVKPGMDFFSFGSAWNTLQGYESMQMLRKGQMHGVGKGNIPAQISFIANLFGRVAKAQREISFTSIDLLGNLCNTASFCERFKIGSSSTTRCVPMRAWRTSRPINSRRRRACLLFLPLSCFDV